MVLRHPRPKIRLSLTPLIDVVFILLVFFMLASQFADWRRLVLVPHAQMSGAVADEETSSLKLLNDGSFTLDGARVDDLQTVIAQLRSLGRGKAVFLAPEETVEIQHVIDVVEALSAAGLTEVQLFDVQGGGMP